MKKIFTLAAAALVGISSVFAGQFKVPVAQQKVDFKMNPTAIKAIEQAAVNEMLNPNSENVIRKSAEINGEIWDAVITNQGGDFWGDLVADDPDSQEFAASWMCGYIRLQKKRSSSSDPVTSYSFLTFWPKNKILLDGTGFGVPADADPQAAYDIQLLINTGLPFEVLEESYMGFKAGADNAILGYGIFNCNSKNPGESEPWFSKYGFYPSYNNNVLCAPGVGSKIYWREYEDATGYVEMAFEGNLLNENGNILTAYSYPYNGTAYVDGFVPMKKEVEASEVHIVNCGEWSSKSCAENDLYIYDIDWGPLQRFYVLFAGKGYTYPLEEFNGTTYPDRPWRVEGTNEPVNYLQGALYSTPGATLEEGGVWTLKKLEPTIESGSYFVYEAPKAGDALFAGFNPDLIFYSDVDGMQCYYETYAAVLQPGTKIAMGVKEEGFYVRGLDQYADNINYFFKGDVIYHYDSNDYSKVKNIPAIGNMSGVESVEVEAGEAEYFDLQGRKVAGELAPGIYIRRAGSKAEKVLVK